MTAIPWANWDAVLAAASDESSPVGSRCELLAAICIAALPPVKESLTNDREGGFPRGRPTKSTVRAAAASLIRAAETVDSHEAVGYRTLGWLLSVYQPAASESDSAVDERSRALESVQYVSVLADPEDPVLIALTQLLLGGRCTSLREYERALDAYDRVLHALEPTDLLSTNHWLYHVAPFLRTDAQPGFAHRLALRAHMYTVSRLLDLGRIGQAQAAADRLVEFTAARQAMNPGDHGWALSRRARVERERRDVPAFLATERELEGLAGHLPEGTAKQAVQLYWWNAAANNATKLGDYARSSEFFRIRIAHRARRDLGIELKPADVSAETLAPIVAAYHRVGSKAQLTNVGNDAYDLALNLFNSGVLQNDLPAREEALRLLDTAEEAWKNFAVNGLFAVSLSRARIDLLDQRSDRAAATATFLRVNAEAVRFNTKRRALVAAVRYGTVGDPAVLARLQELIEQLDPNHATVEGAHLHGLLAEFWLRSCLADEAAGRVAPWQLAADAAAIAAPLLRPAGVSLDPELEAVVWQAAAAATSSPQHTRDRLEHLLRAIGCVAELVVTISTTADRSRVADRFAPLFSEAAELAVALQDDAAADLIMEAARRDRVGLLLAELIANPTVADTIRSTALAVTDSSRQSPDELPVDDTDGEEDGGVSTGTLESRSALILEDRAHATTEAERVLGPLGALCDPQLLRRVTARRILAQRPITEPTAILQLLPLTAGTRAAGGHHNPVPVYRRLTYTTGGAVHEYLDSVHIPRSMLDAPPGDPKLFRSVDTYAKALLPAPLHQLCRAATTEAPIRLLIVPTGFFQVPFELLPSDGSPLVHRAVVSLHGSLTSMYSLLQVEGTASSVPSIAVYDTGRLAHAEDEFASLAKHLPGVQRIGSARDLDTALHPQAPPHTALLAMGVHGTRDEQGWGQTKLMPDGSTVTAADVLRWDVPRLCVLASCHTALTTVDGLELGGFPLALMLRGATTVVGALFAIPDRTTAEIMGYFWGELGRGRDAVRALHHAKISWLADHSQDHSPRSWTGLVTYGCAAG